MKYQVLFALIVGLLSSKARAVFEDDRLKHHRELATSMKNPTVRPENIASQSTEGYKARYLACQRRILSLSGVGFFEIPQSDGTLAYARIYDLGSDFNEKMHCFALNEAGNVVAKILDQDAQQQKILPIRVVRIPNPGALKGFVGLYEWTQECGPVVACRKEDIRIELVSCLPVSTIDVYEGLPEFKFIFPVVNAPNQTRRSSE